MFSKLKAILKLLGTDSSIVGIEQVKANVPLAAEYVTLVDMVVSQTPVEVSETRNDINGSSDFLIGLDESSVVRAFMLHDRVALQFFANGKQIFSTPLSNIDTLQSIKSLKRGALYGRMRGGFICILRDGRSIVISTPVPVPKDQTSTYRTIGRSTDLTGGWAAELAPFGVKVTY